VVTSRIPQVRSPAYPELTLFTFLKYDGVPWNNNNAEHAIKQFVYYREGMIGNLTETGLSDYLVLLSVCQTCKYKGMSFLKFLLSKEQDVDVFWQKKTQEQCLSSIELYPGGFVPRHLRSVYKKKAPQEQGGDPVPMPTETHTTLSDPM